MINFNRVLCILICLSQLSTLAPSQETKEERQQTEADKYENMPILLLQGDATLAGKVGGNISKNDLLENEELYLLDPSGEDCNISSYRLTLVVKGNSPIELFNEVNGKITDAMIRAIKQAPSGSLMYIEYIKCKNEQGWTKKLKAMNFTIQ